MKKFHDITFIPVHCGCFRADSHIQMWKKDDPSTKDCYFILNLFCIFLSSVEEVQCEIVKIFQE